MSKSGYLGIGLTAGIVLGAAGFYTFDYFSDKNSDAGKPEPITENVRVPEPVQKKPIPKQTSKSGDQNQTTETDWVEIESNRRGITDSTFLVKKDILLLSVDVKPVLQDTVEHSYIDTLEDDLNIKRHQFDSYKIEVWQSPLGYEGYRMSGNRISLYGMDSVHNFALVQKENDLILTAGKRKYLIKRVSEFTPLKEYK